MSSGAAFVLFFSLTLCLLALVVATGLAARRRWHIPLVVLALAALGATIRAAVLVGKHYDLPSAGIITPVHLWLAKVTTVLYVLPLATGIRTLFAPGTRKLHRKVAFLVLGMTVLTAITGTAMLGMAVRKD